MNKGTGVTAAVLAAVLAGGAALAAEGKDAPGAALYKAKCASCHAKDGKGNSGMVKMFKTTLAALDLTDAETQGRKDGDLTEVIGKGKGKMPAYAGKLKDAEIADTVAYLRSLAPKEKK